MSTLVTAPSAVSTWNLDAAHSVAEFKVKHMMISNVKGQFTKLTGHPADRRAGHNQIHRRSFNPGCLHPYGG